MHLETLHSGLQEVTKEPIVREVNETGNLPVLVANLGVREVWQPQSE